MKGQFIPDTLYEANEALMKKVEFLMKQKNKNDIYIKDLEESLKFNKQVVRVINKEGPNDKAIKLLSQQNKLLFDRLQQSNEQNKNLHALLLFQTQIRNQQKSFNNERTIEFQNRISDLRKYLHDKEDSFSNVVNRLKKYEQINQLTVADKLHNIRSQFENEMIPELISKLSKQRNEYKEKYQAILQNKHKHPIKQTYKQIHDQNPKNLDATVKIINQANNRYPVNPNKELIRLLKKQKISNQILQEALNEAIQKNEQLISYNDTLVDANETLQQNSKELRAEIKVLESRLSHYEQNYRRKNRVKCDLDRPSYQYNAFSHEISTKEYLKKLQKEVALMSQFMPGKVKNGLVRSGSQNSLPQIEIQNEDQFIVDTY